MQHLESAIDTLIRANRDFQEHAVEATRTAELNERKRITREIHDSIGYTLTNLIVMMESATDFAKTDPARTEALLEQARALAEKGLEEIRYSLRLLRSAVPQRVGGIRAIKQLTDTFSSTTGMAVHVEYGNIPWTLPGEVEEVIYHVVQQCLINSLTHGQASEVAVSLWMAGTRLTVSVSDNGRGAEDFAEGIGFSGIRERLFHLGGSFRVVSRETGFHVEAVVPLPRSGELLS